MSEESYRVGNVADINPLSFIREWVRNLPDHGLQTVVNEIFLFHMDAIRAEREECAKIAENPNNRLPIRAGHFPKTRQDECLEIAANIRARGGA
jgi:hypothetical protein